MASTDSRTAVETRIPALSLTAGDLVNTSPGGDDDWQEVVSVYTRPADVPSSRNEVRELLTTLDGRYVLVELTDIAPVDANVYFDNGNAMLYASDEGGDSPVGEVVSVEDGVRTYLYTKFELVTVRVV